MGSDLGKLAVGALLAAAAVLGGPGCSHTPAVSLCTYLCGCRRCSDVERASCEEQAVAAEAQADKLGCSGELSSLVSCEKRHMICQEGQPSSPDCDDEQASLDSCGGGSISFAATGCAAAQHHVEVCLNIMTSGEGGEMPPCTGASACSAQCVNASSCEVLQDAFNGTPSEQSQPFIECATKCSGTK